MLSRPMKKRDNFEGQRMAVFPQSVIELLKTNVFTQNLYVTDAGFFPKAKNHFINRTKGSTQNIIIICIEGEGKIICENDSSKLSANEYYIIPKNKPHTYFADNSNPWTIYWMHFDGLVAPYFIEDASKRSIEVPISQFSLREHIFPMLNEMYLILEESFSINQLTYCSVLFTYILGSLKHERQNQTLKKEAGKRYGEDAVRFMKNNFHKKISVQDVANHCQVSLSHFCLVFKQETSHTPIEYLTMLRIQNACTLLAIGDKKIKEIATEVGFEDPYYFTRVFTKLMGKSPKQYRISKKV